MEATGQGGIVAALHITGVAAMVVEVTVVEVTVVGVTEGTKSHIRNYPLLESLHF